MKVVSLFDGISCGRVALDRANIKVDEYIASEIDKKSMFISLSNYPDIKEIGDIRNVGGLGLLNYCNGKIDLMIGGSPCQNFSFTGTRNGMRTKSKTKVTTLEQYLEMKKDGYEFEGESYLFWEYVRLLKIIKPTFFLLENVVMKKEWIEVISNALECEPILIDSADFCAQERKRLYWTNIPVQPVNFHNTDVLKDILEDESKVLSYYYYKIPPINIDMSKQICATLPIPIYEMHQRVFNPNFKCHTLTACGGGNIQKKVLIGNKVRKLTPLEYERLQTLPDGYTSMASDSVRYNTIGNGWTVDVIAYILSFLPDEYKIKNNEIKEKE